MKFIKQADIGPQIGFSNDNICIILQEAVNVPDVKVLKVAQDNIVNPGLCKYFSVRYTMRKIIGKL